VTGCTFVHIRGPLAQIKIFVRLKLLVFDSTSSVCTAVEEVVVEPGLHLGLLNGWWKRKVEDEAEKRKESQKDRSSSRYQEGQEEGT
jgi:hypothetical protein